MDEEKLPFDIDVIMSRIDKATENLPKAALFQLAEEGYVSVFQQLIACIISIHTYDEITTPTSIRLFEVAPTPERLASLSVEAINEIISHSTFHEAKAIQIQEIAQRTVDEYGGIIPCDTLVLQSFRGVGAKCANLVLGIACGMPRISVDIHVHRVTNRWGYVDTKNPDQTLAVLEVKLPKRYWVDINRLLVPFGKHICTGDLPHCSTCVVLDMCRQRGVARHR